MRPLVVMASGGPSPAEPLGHSPSWHLAWPLGRGSLELCLWGVEGQRVHEYWVCVIGGVSETSYRGVWEEEPLAPAPRGFSSQHSPVAVHRSPEVPRVWASFGKSGQGCSLGVWFRCSPSSFWCSTHPSPSSCLCIRSCNCRKATWHILRALHAPCLKKKKS